MYTSMIAMWRKRERERDDRKQPASMIVACRCRLVIIDIFFSHTFLILFSLEDVTLVSREPDRK